jgi:hypothetical protein
MTKKIKIYVNGDSHSDGAGLADPETFPDLYPGHLTSVPMTVNWKWCDLRSSMIYQDISFWKLCRDNNRKYVWGTILGELVNAEVVNNSVGGSCMLGIATRTIADLEIMRKSNSLPTHVFIGLTNPDRLGLYNIPDIYEAEKTFNWVQSVVPHIYAIGHSKKYKKLFEATWSTLSDEEFLIAYLKECLLIKNYVTEKIGRDPIFLNTSYIFYRYSTTVYNSQNKWLRMLWFDLLEFDKINTQYFNIKIPITTFTACGHLLPDAHREFAKDLAREYFGVTD